MLQTNRKMPCPPQFHNTQGLSASAGQMPRKVRQRILKVSTQRPGLSELQRLHPVSKGHCMCSSLPVSLWLVFVVELSNWDCSRATESPLPIPSEFSLLCYESYFCLSVPTPFPRLGPQEVRPGGEEASQVVETTQTPVLLTRSTPPGTQETGSEPALVLSPSPSPLVLNG